MKDAAQQEQRRVFDAVCARYTPVMHHFFLEAFRDPVQWFQARITYTRRWV